MGQKVNPYGIRLEINLSSRWFFKIEYTVVASRFKN